MTPEAKARQQIDDKLVAAGWLVQDLRALNLGAGRGIAVREYPTDTGPADYLLFVDRTPVGVIEAKPDSTIFAIKECRLDIYPAGSLLVAMYGEGKTRGKCAELAFPATINQAIACLVFESAADACKSYVKLFLLKSYELMREQASGGVQPNLNLQIIKAIVLPLPPLSEQSEIGGSIAELFDQIHQQAQAIQHGLRQSAAQRKNILQAAFSGQLVPQDPNDEPASVLLARIRAERAASGIPTRARGRKKKETS